MGLAVRLLQKQVKVADATQGQLDELAKKPGLAKLHDDLKVRTGNALRDITHSCRI